VTFSDPGTDPATCRVDYGDGRGWQAVPAAGAGAFVLRSTYGATGTYLVRVMVTDHDGAATAASFQARVTIAPARVIAAARVGSSALALTFSEPMNAARARQASNYLLVGAGRDNRFGTADDTPVAIRSVSYNNAQRKVQIRLRSAFPAGQALRIVARATSTRTHLIDAAGRLLDGDGDGRAGRDFVRVL
jgi:hypothetical protein